MKRLSLAIALTLFTLPLLGQSAALTTPKTYASAPSAVTRKFAVDDTTQTAWVIVGYATDSTGTTIREEQRIDIPANLAVPGTEYTDFLSAIGSPAVNETGTVRRRANYRILNYLCVTAARLSCSSLTP